jgi:hypothetical protein
VEEGGDFDAWEGVLEWGTGGVEGLSGIGVGLEEVRTWLVDRTRGLNIQPSFLHSPISSRIIQSKSMCRRIDCCGQVGVGRWVTKLVTLRPCIIIHMPDHLLDDWNASVWLYVIEETGTWPIDEGSRKDNSHAVTVPTVLGSLSR